MHVALVGGAGFIGTALSAVLLRQGYSVEILDIHPPDDHKIGVTFTLCDITEDSNLSERLGSADAIILLAGLMDKSCREKPQLAWRVNVEGTFNVIKAAAESERLRRIIYLSSAMVYEAAQGTWPLNENARVCANGLYSASKLSAEYALQAAAKSRRFSTLILRPFTVYGPGPMCGERGHFIGRWLSMAANGEPLTIYGNGSQIIDLVHVDILTELCSEFLRRSHPELFQVLNVTGGAPTTIVDVARCFQLAFDGIRTLSVPESSGQRSRGWGDATASRAYVGRSDSNLLMPRATLEHFLKRHHLATSTGS